MGKVKNTFDIFSHYFNTFVEQVSIPYGKGKEKEYNEKRNADKYQFPMGKVKNNILRCVFIIIHRYRFVK